MAGSRKLVALCFLSAAFILMFGCGELVRRDGSGTGERTPADVESRGIDMTKDRFVVPERIPEGAGSEIAGDRIDWQIVDSLRRAGREVDSVTTIYRVQIFASQYYSEAGYEKEVAQDVFSEPVYVTYDVPYYKIIIGNCTDLKSANRLLDRARSLGYDNGWVVESPPDSIYYNSILSPDLLESTGSTAIDSSEGAGDRK